MPKSKGKRKLTHLGNALSYECPLHCVSPKEEEFPAPALHCQSHPFWKEWLHFQKLPGTMLIFSSALSPLLFRAEVKN